MLTKVEEVETVLDGGIFFERITPDSIFWEKQGGVSKCLAADSLHGFLCTLECKHSGLHKAHTSTSNITAIWT